MDSFYLYASDSYDKILIHNRLPLAALKAAVDQLTTKYPQSDVVIDPVVMDGPLTESLAHFDSMKAGKN